MDVRVPVPDDCDNTLVRLSGWSFVAPLEEADVKVYRHTHGFMHHKIPLAAGTRPPWGRPISTTAPSV